MQKGPLFYGVAAEHEGIARRKNSVSRGTNEASAAERHPERQAAGLWPPQPPWGHQKLTSNC